MVGADRPQGPRADRPALRAGQRRGACGSGPRGAVQATAGGAMLDPDPNRRGQALGQAEGASRSPEEREPVEALRPIGLTPAWPGP
jgi:hypothetical protein